MNKIDDMNKIDQVQRDRRFRKPVTVHDPGERPVRVRPLRFDAHNFEHVELVARALGYFNFSDWRGGMRMKAQRPDDDGSMDGRRRSPLPMFQDLDDAWRFLNYFVKLDVGNRARVAFFLMLGPNFGNIPVDPWVVACRIMDCAFSVITIANERGWL